MKQLIIILLAIAPALLVGQNIVITQNNGNVTSDTCYAVPISGGNANSVLWVCASNTGVTASFAAGTLTIVSTSTAKVKTADWRLINADIQDPGSLRFVQVAFTGMVGNTSLSNARIPAVTKVAIPGTNALSPTNQASVDIDNNPFVSVVGLANNSVTFRVGGLIDAGQGYLLKFSGVH